MRLSQRRGLMVWPGPELEGIPKVPSQSSDGGGPSTLSQQDENADRVARSGLGTGSSKSLKRAATSREKMTPPTKKSRSPSATEILLSFKKDALSAKKIRCQTRRKPQPFASPLLRAQFQSPGENPLLLESRQPNREQKKMEYRAFLDGEAAKLRRLKISVSPRLQPSYRALEEKLLALSSSLSQWQGLLSPLSEGIWEFQKQLSQLDEEIVQDLHNDLNTPTLEEARKIFDGLISGWRGFVEPVPGTDRVKQTHAIKGLKVYRLPGTDTLIADYARKEIGSGTFKRAKSMVRVEYLEGSPLQELVRLTPRSKKEAFVSVFQKDISKELGARAVLSQEGVPHVAGMTLIRYVSKNGKEKIRYVMTRYASDASKLEGTERGILCAIDVAEGLAAMHKKGLVHGDVKEENILTDGIHGYISDLGLMGNIGTPLQYAKGSPFYMAPETLRETDIQKRVGTTALDMFSFGIFLLGMVSPALKNSWWNRINPLEGWYNKELEGIKIREAAQKTVLSSEREALSIQYYSVYSQVHQLLPEALLQLSRTKDSPRAYLLILDLLHIDPTKRPSAEKALQRLRELYPH